MANKPLSEGMCETGFHIGLYYQNSAVASYTQRCVLAYPTLNKLQICNFLVTILTNKLVISTILFLECIYNTMLYNYIHHINVFFTMLYIQVNIFQCQMKLVLVNITYSRKNKSPLRKI